MNRLLEEYRQGDERAINELLSAVMDRLFRLARKMMRSYPIVRRWEESDDILQNAVLRLTRALQQTTPQDTRAFYGLAAEQIRRELLDMARRYRSQRGAGFEQAPMPSTDSGSGVVARAVAPADGYLDRWAAFHEAVDALPDDEREVFSLVFYHGWTQPQIAGLLDMNERTIRRYWRAACVRLCERLDGEMPA
ncbi:RNA polymerase sigma factor [Limnoglobus roseus]|nr:sigma-70 family RNA polymerase sigma factor [Limnoglobus roseus]